MKLTGDPQTHQSKKHSLKASLASISTARHLSSSSSSSSGSSSGGSASSSDHDDNDSPPISPLRSPLFSPISTSNNISSSSASSSWGFSSQGSHSAAMAMLMDDGDSNGSHSSCNSKETYNTKFAKYHLETYRQNDRMRWNFDFDHNRPLDNEHHHHRQATPRYQWEPAL